MTPPTEDPRLLDGVARVLQYLTQCLPELMTSGENWQVTLHGGRGGDVIVEQVRKTTVVRRAGDAGQ